MEPGMVKDLALGAVTPAVIALVYFIAAWSRRPAPAASGGPLQTDWRLVGTPLVMAAATIAAYILILGTPQLVPVRAMEWTPLIALAAGVAGAIAAVERLPALLRWTPVLVVVVGVWWVSARSPIAHKWTLAQAAAELVEFVLAAAVAMTAAHRLTRASGMVGVLVLTLFAGAVSQLLVFGHFSMSLGQIAGMPAAMLGAALCVSLRRRQLQIGAGGVVFVSVIALTMLLQGRLFGAGDPDVERGYASLAILALVGAALVHAGFPPRLARVRAAAVVATAAIPLIVSVTFAAKNWFAQGEEEQYTTPDDYPL
jgi:hypothetical protein